MTNGQRTSSSGKTVRSGCRTSPPRFAASTGPLTDGSPPQPSTEGFSAVTDRADARSESLDATRTSARPSQSTTTRRESPAVAIENPCSLLARARRVHAPSRFRPCTRDHRRSLTVFETVPTNTPVWTSSRHLVSRPRKDGVTFVTTSTITPRSRSCAHQRRCHPDPDRKSVV